MIRNYHISTVLLVAVFSIFSLNIMGIDTIHAEYSCTRIGSTLTYGTNSVEVTALQKFLIYSGYLNASSNGHFGNATLSAVKKFQSANGIKATGQVGPQTRSAIQNISCQTKIVPNQTQLNTTNPQTSVKTSTILDSNALQFGANATKTVVSPVASSTLIIDNSINIQWSAIPGAIYDILLMDIGNIGVGYIATNVSSNQYSWNIGHIFTSSDTSGHIIDPGIYKIVLRPNSNHNSSVYIQYSGLFTVVGKPIVINNLLPTTVSNNGKASIAIYGSGFDSSTKLYFDEKGEGYSSNSSYISRDGNIVIFNIPSYLEKKSYNVMLNNTYSSGATSTPSNSVRLDII